MVATPQFLIDVVGAGVKRVQGARAAAPGVDAGAMFADHEAGKPKATLQVLLALVDVEKAVNPSTGEG
jgi:hypothetical protein